MLGFRFVYGMCTITPLILGVDRTIRVLRSVLLNLIGAALWSTVIATGGYVLGRVPKIFLEDIKHYEPALVLIILLIGIALKLLSLYKEKLKAS